VLLPLVSTTAVLGACSDDDAGPADTAPVISTRPEFVNRIIPGRRPLALVVSGDTGDAAATLSGTSSLGGMVVSFEQTTLIPGEAVEVWVDVPEVVVDTDFTVTVRATRGAASSQVDIRATAVPGVDDVSGTAKEIAAVFLRHLAGSVPGGPITVADLGNGTPVAGLLVVTHYAWFTDAYEVGLGWHIMVAPSDWAVLYLRPRHNPAPARAFRINSWSRALSGANYTFEEITPPADVTR